MRIVGFEATQGAHVDTTFLEYRQIGQMLLPTQLTERVRGPIRIHAHRWHLTRADVNRGWNVDDVRGADLQGLAAEPARKSEQVPDRFVAGIRAGIPSWVHIAALPHCESTLSVLQICRQVRGYALREHFHEVSGR